MLRYLKEGEIGHGSLRSEFVSPARHSPKESQNTPALGDGWGAVLGNARGYSNHHLSIFFSKYLLCCLFKASSLYFES